jgi:hypothetical protein
MSGTIKIKWVSEEESSTFKSDVGKYCYVFITILDGFIYFF